jgi:hypothetical protein
VTQQQQQPNLSERCERKSDAGDRPRQNSENTALFSAVLFFLASPVPSSRRFSFPICLVKKSILMILACAHSRFPFQFFLNQLSQMKMRLASVSKSLFKSLANPLIPPGVFWQGTFLFNFFLYF